ncbi:hypothetical protein ACLMJK_003035 [Lecanora helva]
MANETTAAPIVVQPSQHWEGNDGPWSTFDLHVGTPPQPVRVLISSALGETWVISANKTQGGCLEGQDPTSCPQSRGALFNINASTTWQDQGLYGVGLETNLPDYVGNYDVADYGMETVGLGIPGSNGVTLPNHIVGALATKDFYLGYFGVTNQPTNFTQFDDPHQSFLSTLKAENKIPSLSYSYSAGAPYRFKKVDGTLTLGGYDASRFTPNDLNFRFASDISRDLVVGLQSITYSDSKNTNQHLLSEGILTFIDSTVPGIWLPQDACTLFEDAFGLTYNDTVDRYLVNDTLHQQLKSQDPSISFFVGNDINGGATVNITFPYSAFDLQVSTPIVNGTENYFPLRRAANDTQYTLGRTFLQEAYIIVDYERSNFTVAQASWVENAQQHIIPIKSVNDTSQPPPTPTKKSSGISTGAIVGIIVAAVVLILLSAVGAFFIIRQRRKKRKEAEKKDDDDEYRKPEMDGHSKPPIGELYAEGKLGEVDSSSKVEMQGSQPGIATQEKRNMAEAEGSRGGVEMEGTTGGEEMEGSHGSHLRAEMAGDHLAPVELDAGPQGLYEMPSPNTSNSELPSPLSGSERRSGLSATWSRRQKPTPKLPDSESSDTAGDAGPQSKKQKSGTRIGRPTQGPQRSLNPYNISSPSSSNRERRPSQPLPSHASSPNSVGRHPHPGSSSPRDTAADIPLRSRTPMEVSSQSSSSRERQQRPSNGFDRRIESSNRTSPRDGLSPHDRSLGRANSEEEWNRRFGSRDRSLTPGSPDGRSPVSSPERRPSPLGNGLRNVGSRSGAPAQEERREGSPMPSGNFF